MSKGLLVGTLGGSLYLSKLADFYGLQVHAVQEQECPCTRRDDGNG